MLGNYNVLDIDEMKGGVRKEVWHGWGWTDAKRDEYEKHKAQIDKAVRRQLAEFRMFVAEIWSEKRMLERLEAKIMELLYQQAPPLCDVPDKGMRLCPRWKTEAPIFVTNIVKVRLY